MAVSTDSTAVPSAAPRPAANVLAAPAAVLWLAALALLLAGIGAGAVDRAQEARVLETAREMLGAGPHQWLVPRVNGNVRLQKPPLAYWMAAGAFKVLGVGEGAGRAPFAVVGLLTVGVTYVAARWLFGRRAAFLAAAALLGSELFFRHSRLAETDGPVALFVTIAFYSLWRGVREGVEGAASDRSPPDGSADFGEPSRADFGDLSRAGAPPSRDALRAGPSAFVWFNAAAVAMALACLTKGPPAFYPLVFLVGLVAVERRWGGLLQFVLSGAPLTFALVALPWFAYAMTQPDFRQAVGDLRNSAGGGLGHNEWFFVYFYQLFVATAPWAAFVVAGIVDAVGRWRVDWRVRGLLLWSASILLPLCLWGNKQIHYLMPLMPPLMILAGGWIDRAVSEAADARAAKAVRVLLLGTLAACAVAAPGAAVTGCLQRGRVAAPDLALGGAVLAIVATSLLAYRRRGVAEGAVAAAATTPAALALAIGWWLPSLEAGDPRATAAALRAKFGDGPYVFYGGETLPLVFHLRSIVPIVRDEPSLAAVVAREPRVVVLEPRRRQLTEPSAVGLSERESFRSGETTVRVYTAPGR